MIIYPVDPASLWAEYSIALGKVTSRRTPWGAFVSNGTERVGLDKDIVMLRHVDGDKPTPDRSINKVVQSPEIIDLDNNTLHINYTLAPLSEAQLDSQARSSQRESMREDFDALPLHLRGAYRTQFEIANLLLDKGEDQAAAELLDYIEPTEEVNGSSAKQTEFNTVKASFKSKIAALTPSQ